MNQYDIFGDAFAFDPYYTLFASLQMPPAGDSNYQPPDSDFYSSIGGVASGAHFFEPAGQATPIQAASLGLYHHLEVPEATVLHNVVETNLSLSPTPSIEDTSLDVIYSSTHTDHEVNPFGDPQSPTQADLTNLWIDSSVADSQPAGVLDSPSDYASSRLSPLIPTPPEISDDSEESNASSSTPASFSPLSSPSPAVLDTEVTEPGSQDGGSPAEGPSKPATRASRRRQAPASVVAPPPKKKTLSGSVRKGGPQPKEGPRYYCDLPNCKESCSRYHDVKRHKRTRHGNGPKPECPACGRFFSRDDGMQRHLKGRCQWKASEIINSTEYKLWKLILTEGGRLGFKEWKAAGRPLPDATASLDP